MGNKCKKCNKNFDSSVKLLEHLVKHCNPKVCYNCGSSFSGIQALNYHIKNRKLIRCDHCDGKYCNYIIKFRPDPQQLTFETLRYFATARDIIQTVRNIFKIYHRKIMVYDILSTMLKDTDPVGNGRTYIIKCTPPRRVRLIL